MTPRTDCPATPGPTCPSRSWLRRPIAVDRLAVVVASIADHWEPVVLSFLDHVDLVAAAGAVLARPQPARAGMQRKTLIIADAEREDLGPRACTTDEGIVFGHAAIVV